MTTTRDEARIASNLCQIADLRVRRDVMVSECLRGGVAAAKCLEMTGAIGEQIVALYEEIDAIEAGETTQANRSENECDKEDEVALVTREEVLAVAHLGWTAQDVIKAKKRKVLYARR